MINCECTTWADTGGCARASMLGNGHHPKCVHYLHDVGALKLIVELVKGIRWWGSQEDGIPDELWEPYRRAVFIVEGRIVEEKKP